MTDTNRCPFCRQANHCMAQSNEKCWCAEVEIPQELLNLVPDADNNESCICIGCIQTFKDNPEDFKRKWSTD